MRASRRIKTIDSQEKNSIDTGIWIAIIVPVLIGIMLIGYLTGSDDRRIHQAKNVVADQLIDPDSAKFRNLEIMNSGHVCGEVNGKNTFGAYVGFKWFYAQTFDDADPFVKFEDDAVLSHFVRKYCTNHPGYDPNI